MMDQFKKLGDVSWEDADINRFSRLDRYWTNKSSVLRGKIHERSTKVYVQKAVEQIGLTPADMMKEYRLKGVEFGRWLNTPERYDHFCSGMLALEDLANVMGTHNLGMDHHIGLAFGARGNGGRRPAAAHFEPLTFMINLTKENGASCFAHEYGHALDYFFGMYVDLNTLSPSLSGGREVGSSHYWGKRGKYRRMMLEILTHIMKTESYKRWHKSKSRNYYCNHTEMFARCFEQWVADELHKKGVVNRYLTVQAELYAKGSAYLSEDEKKTVWPEMKRLVKEMAKAANEK